MMGRGGKQMMTPADRGRVGGLLRAQYSYLDAFVGEVANGTMSPDAIRNRTPLYAETTRGAYDRGHASAWEVDLPEHPPKHPRCRCRWKIEEKQSREETHASWMTDRSGGACQYCLDAADDYNPLVIKWPARVARENAEALAEAERLYDRASIAEPGVTRDLRLLESRIDGDLNRPIKLANGKTVYPLDSRLKTVDSTARKISTDASLPGGSVTRAADNIKDNLRYTYIVDEGSYGQSVNTILSGLDEIGYERVAVKNFWEKQDGYTGVHGIYRTTDGQFFEVQFHTTPTIETKELISHPIYEKQRKHKEDSPEWQKYEDQVKDAWRPVRDDPPNLSGLP
jgi:hypothetical protein